MSKKVSSVKNNMLMNVLMTGSSVLLPLIVFPYVSRALLPEALGRVELATSVINYFIMLAQLGIPTYGIVACARVRDNREELSRRVQELMLINLGATVIAYVILAAMVVSIGRFRQEAMLYILMSIIILLNALGVEWLYQALEKYTYIAIRSIVFKLAAAAAMLMLIHSPGDYLLYGVLTVVAGSASNILNFINIRRYIELKPTGGYSFLPHIKAMLPFMMISVTVSIYTNLDAVMLGLMKTNAEVGYYAAAVKIKMALVRIIVAMTSVLLPRAAYYFEQKRSAELRVLLARATRLIVCTTIAMSLYFVQFADSAILFLVGDAYHPSIPAMRIIMLTLVIIGISNLLGGQILVAQGREKAVAAAALLGAVTDCVLNLILIGPLGASGAAIATLAAEVAVLAYVLIRSDRDILAAAAGDIRVARLVFFALGAVILGGAANLVCETPLMSLIAGAACYAILFVIIWGKDVRRELLHRN